MKKLIFIENLATLEKIYPEILNLYTVIAITPHVGYELDKKGVFYKTPDDYITLERLTEFGKEICAETDVFISKLKSFFTPPFFYYYETKNYYLFCRLLITVLSRLEIVKLIIKREQPDEIYYEPNSPYIKDTNEFFYFRQKSIYSELIPIAAKKNNITLKECYENKVKPQQTSKILFNRISKSVYNHAVQSKTVNHKDTKTVLFLDSANNNKALYEEVVRRGECTVLHWDMYTDNTWDVFFSSEDMFEKKSDIAEFKGIMDGIWDDLSQNKEFKKLFVFGEFDLWDVLKDHFNYYVTEFIPKSYVAYCAFEKMIKKKKIDAVVASVITAKTYINETIITLANKHGIPTVLHQHGGFMGYVNKIMYNKTELTIPKYYFGFGQGLADYVRNHNLPVEVCPVGSSLIEAQCADLPDRKTICELIGIDPSKKIVGYVPTALLGKQYYTPGSVYPDHMYFSMLKRLFNFFRQYEDVQFVVKPYNTEHNRLISRYVKEQKFFNIKTISNNIRHLNSIVDMYVLDLGSTILLEAIASGKPVLYMHNQLVCPIENGSLELLRKRVHLSEKWQDFTSDFDSLIINPEKDRKCHHDEFFKRYVNPDINQKSFDRAYNALMDICFKECSKQSSSRTKKDVYYDRAAS